MQIGVDSQRAVENKRVFIIDTDEVSGMALQFMLADDNETHVLPGVSAVLEKGRDWPPDLILLGAGVISAEGAEWVGRFKSRFPGVKIVVVCDSADAPEVKGALAQGANSALLRPLKIEAVRRKVDTQLGRRVGLAIPVVPV